MFKPSLPSKEILHEYSTRVKTVVKLILRVMAESLNLEETDYFISQFGEKMGIYCRCCHYPSSSRPGPVFGLRPHSDNSVITIISQGGDVEGLELLKDDQWIKVPTNPDVLLIMVGDLMEIMSNGRFKSSVHRVVAHRERERISTILFYMLDPEKEIGPPEELLKEGSPRMYRDLKVKDYIDAHLKSYSEGKRGIDWAKA
ncbi:hypothetical protein Taro_028701 [Colocasia esculenta]|uniref:Fe2OG dioxygenase domain-containing protein n=1 Tax=Colocasia esculenta TaxID=4460 RepID=A0A843VSP4_COLES|nr:hypothetical protein [Colocasia esculenta]